MRYTIYQDRYGSQYCCDKKERIIAFRKARWVNYIYENPSGYRWTRVKHKMYLENHLGYKPEVVTKCIEQEFLEMLFDEL